MGGPGGRSHCAVETPCQLGGGSVAGRGPNVNSRVCVPASVSTFKVVSSCQVMCSRPGTRMIAPAPKALHWLPAASSAAGSHASAILRASGVIGTKP